MKRLPVIFLAATLALVAMVTGCSGPHRYDSRLTAADALMHDNPDSAMAIIGAVNPRSLNSQADRAFHALLLTQARYRCYIVATSDSDINRALDYYRAHPREREKLTRAHLYKGAVMEELGHPDSAMFYYKSAEAIADNSDYFILGQINTRIADLYRKYFADDQTCYDKYKKALYYYQQIDNKPLQFDCLYYMGMCAGITGKRDSKQLLQQAASLASKMKDSLKFFKSREMQARQICFKESNVIEAKNIALDLLHNYSNYLSNDLLLDLSDIYLKEHKLDSSKYYLNFVNPSINAQEEDRIKVRQYTTMKNIAKSEGDVINTNRYLDSCEQLSNSMVFNKYHYDIQLLENAGNEKHGEEMKKMISSQALGISILTFILLLSLLWFIVVQIRNRNRTCSLIRELEKSGSTDHHEDLLRQLGDKDVAIGQFVNKMITLMQTSIDASEKDSPTIIRRRIRTTINDIANKDFWDILRNHLDSRYNNLISEIAENPKIKDSDIKLIELSCCGFSYIEIAITMDYSTKYISQKRKEIEKKLGLSMPLQDYLTTRTNNNDPQTYP